MYEDLNAFILNSLSSVTTLPKGSISFILLWFCILACTYIGCTAGPPNEDPEDPDPEGFLFIVLFIIHLVFNIHYSFFCSPDHFIWITKILIFIIPYIVVFLITYYWSKISRE